MFGLRTLSHHYNTVFGLRSLYYSNTVFGLRPLSYHSNTVFGLRPLSDHSLMIVLNQKRLDNILCKLLALHVSVMLTLFAIRMERLLFTMLLRAVTANVWRNWCGFSSRPSLLPWPNLSSTCPQQLTAMDPVGYERN